MHGKVALEEAFCLPSDRSKEDWWAGMFAVDVTKHCEEIIDLHNIRIQKMDKYGVGYQILSYTAPGIQDMYDQKEAETKAKEVNDYIAKEIRGSEDRFGVLA